MAYRVRKVNYCKMTVSSRAGQGEQVLRAIKEAGIDMYAFSGFPTKAGKSQVDFVSGDTVAIKRLAKKFSWRLSNTKKSIFGAGQ